MANFLEIKLSENIIISIVIPWASSALISKYYQEIPS